MIFKRLARLVLAVVLMGCAHPAVETVPAAGGYIRGNASIISIDPESGHALLEFEGRKVDAYWQTEMHLAQGGALIKNDPLKPAVGQYAEPVVKPQTLHAKVGDKITFVGLSSPSGILLRSVVVAH